MPAISNIYYYTVTATTQAIPIILLLVCHLIKQLYEYSKPFSALCLYSHNTIDRCNCCVTSVLKASPQHKVTAFTVMLFVPN